MGQIGQEIRRRREEQGLSQAQLAKMAGTGPAAISRIENGHQFPRLPLLARLARALECEVGDLFPKAQTPLPFPPEVGEWRTYPSTPDRPAARAKGVRYGAIKPPAGKSLPPELMDETAAVIHIAVDRARRGEEEEEVVRDAVERIAELMLQR